MPIVVGATVQCRNEPNGQYYRVTAANGNGKVTVEPISGGEPMKVAKKDVLVVKRFGDPIYPALRSVGAVRRGAPDKPHHAVISGENFHALQLFVYLYEGKADCIYLDPPYNTGARDWKYNNDYVDKNDSWRHSKWLSMMEKRLRLVKRLLKPDGVLIVTIDEHEVNHLGMLLERLFPDHYRYLITIVISARGNFKTNFARVEEYAYFCCPNIGRDVISGTKLDLLPEHSEIDVGPEPEDSKEQQEFDFDEFDDPSAEAGEKVVTEGGQTVELRHARRRGPDSSRKDRPSMFFPIYIDEKKKEIVRIGMPIDLTEEPSMETVQGLRPVWPIDAEGEHRRWRWGHERMRAALTVGGIQLGSYNKRQDSWTINLVIQKEDDSKKIKTVWRHTSHDAGTHGTSLVDKLLGQRGLFPFPKSVYAVRDCLAAAVRQKPDALIIDVFAGSGTTLHATALLNAEDNGRRRCVLVTNNEVQETVAARLAEKDLYRGDKGFESQGIFELITRPRCEAVVRGTYADEKPIPGKHVDGRKFSEGFPENVEFFETDYLDPDEIDLGHQFDAILSSLWLAAGGVGDRETKASGRPYSITKGSTYGVLFRESAFRKFKDEVLSRPDVTHLWLVTDSEEAFAEMCSALPRRLTISMLYRDYLQNFRINTRQNL